jgi:RNA polymerase sigma-70 factor (ECF subfamily)
MNEDSERALIARFQAGDQGAYNTLLEAHQRRVVHLALQVLRNEDAALDVAQEVFLRAYEELPNWRGEARVSTWLYRTALNVCFERIRAEEKQRRLRDSVTEEALASAPENQFSSGEVLAAIDHAVKQLPPRQRVIFAMKQYEELRFHEIATMLNITEGGAKASYHKALMSLRERLRSYAPEPARIEPEAAEDSSRETL